MSAPVNIYNNFSLSISIILCSLFGGNSFDTKGIMLAIYRRLHCGCFFFLAFALFKLNIHKNTISFNSFPQFFNKLKIYYQDELKLEIKSREQLNFLRG
uniref:Uncharacterized protein n=1 Tax=Octopus bimaculoides TaxID=37653 RepID=A0A0L8IDA3_OCTBM